MSVGVMKDYKLKLGVMKDYKLKLRKLRVSDTLGCLL